MNILQQPSFWIGLYSVLGGVCLAVYAYLVEKDLRRHEAAVAMGLPPDGDEHGWDPPGRLSLLPIIGIFWPGALLWLATIAAIYFFWHSLTWYAWRTAAWAWLKRLGRLICSWRPGVKAKEERVVLRDEAAKRAERKKRENARKAETTATKATAKAVAKAS